MVLLFIGHIRHLIEVWLVLYLLEITQHYVEPTPQYVIRGGKTRYISLDASIDLNQSFMPPSNSNSIPLYLYGRA